MKRTKIFLIVTVVTGVSILFSFYGCSSTSKLANSYPTDTLYTNPEGTGELLEISFSRGPEHNHPLMAVWLEDADGNYLQTLYVAESIAKGIYGHGDKSTGKWMPGPIRRPATLPVWAHKRGVKEADGLFIPTQETAIPDAYTGATPPAHFVLLAKADKPLPGKFNLYFEINQTWDWNEYWTNNKYPGDTDYKTSCQPALVYHTEISGPEYDTKNLELIGHSHYNGSDGSITTDLSTITTAKEIASGISVRVIR